MMRTLRKTAIFFDPFAWVKKTGVGGGFNGSIHPRTARRLPVGWRSQRRFGAVYFSNVRTNGVGCATSAIAPARRDGQVQGRGACSAC